MQRWDGHLEQDLGGRLGRGVWLYQGLEEVNFITFFCISYTYKLNQIILGDHLVLTIEEVHEVDSALLAIFVVPFMPVRAGFQGAVIPPQPAALQLGDYNIDDDNWKKLIVSPRPLAEPPCASSSSSTQLSRSSGSDLISIENNLTPISPGFVLVFVLSAPVKNSFQTTTLTVRAGKLGGGSLQTKDDVHALEVHRDLTVDVVDLGRKM